MKREIKIWIHPFQDATSLYIPDDFTSDENNAIVSELRKMGRKLGLKRSVRSGPLGYMVSNHNELIKMEALIEYANGTVIKNILKERRNNK